ncbi:class II aldolase/adducin N-terminal [Xylaria sp. FL1042]|nr:class II aldolase/adducin N-terminal [Xylaria sp. FL1042]
MSPSATSPATEKMDIFTKKGADKAILAVGANDRSTIPTLPTFTSKVEEQKYHKERLAGAFRIFAQNGFDEGVSGHMSLRDPINPKTFWINPYAMHFADITVSDLVCVTEDAEVVSGKHAVNAAGFAIHSEIHKAHPWINAVCHAHSDAGKAWSAFGRPLPASTQDSLKFYGRHSILHEYHGPVLSTQEGKAIAGVVSENTNVVILKNHGLLSIGTTIDEACYWFCSFDRCCRSQLMIDAATSARGEPFVIDDDVAKEAADTIGARSRGWFHFQPYYSNMVKQTGGAFLR